MRSVKLDWVRSFAGFWVVVFHSSLAYESYVGDLSQVAGSSFYLEGHSGVALFFSLSGFLISGQILQGNVDWRTFLYRRVKKLIPLYYLLTLIFFCLTTFGIASINSDPKVVDLAYSLFFLKHITLSQPPVLYVGWSLEYEVLFYILSIISLISPYPSILLIIGTCILSILSPLIYLPFLFGISCSLVAKYFVSKFGYFIVFLPMICIYLFSICGGNFIVLVLFVGFLLIPNKFLFGDYISKMISNSTYAIYLLQVFTIPVLFKIISYYSPGGMHGFDIFLVFLGTVTSGIILNLIFEKYIITFFDCLIDKLKKFKLNIKGGSFL